MSTPTDRPVTNPEPVPVPGTTTRSRGPRLDHERLDVYERALEFHALACTLVPRRGLRTLRDQLERASLGVVLNIAEGAGRTSGADKRRFYEMGINIPHQPLGPLERSAKPPAEAEGEAPPKSPAKKGEAKAAE